jgi:hypothetical protein
MVKTLWVLILLYTSPGQVHTLEEGVYDSQGACVMAMRRAGTAVTSLQPFLLCVPQIDA